jgi:hypothetical protein
MAINMPGWKLKFYNELGLPQLSPEAEAIIGEHDEEMTERGAKRQQPSEKRKLRLARKRRRNYRSTVETRDPQYKGITKKKAATKKPGDVMTHRTLDDALAARFPRHGETDSDDDSDYQPPANSEEEEEEEEDEEDAVDQPRINEGSSDDENDPSSRELKDQVGRLLREAQEREHNDDEMFIVQPWHEWEEFAALE